MKSATFTYFAVAFILLSQFTSCNKTEDGIVNPPPDNDLLYNTSFEQFGLPNLSRWRLINADTTIFHFSRSVPPGGGKISITIEDEWPGYGLFIVQYVPAPVGSHIYRLSVWGKADFCWGRVYFGVKTPDSIITRKHITVFDTAWTRYSCLDTITTTESDSLGVSIIGGYVDIARRGAATSFDLCELELLK